MSEKKVHNLEAHSIQLSMKQMLKINEADGLSIEYLCEVESVPNKRQKKKIDTGT